MALSVNKENGHGKQAAAKQARELNKTLEVVMEECMHESVHYPKLLSTHYRPFSPEVYGDTSYKVITKIMEKVQPGRNDTFLDLGSGLGQVVLQVAGSTLCKISCGIEGGKMSFNHSTKEVRGLECNQIRHPKYESEVDSLVTDVKVQKHFHRSRRFLFIMEPSLAVGGGCKVGLLSRYKAIMKNKGMHHAEISLFFGNFLDARFRKTILSATVIFVNNLVFGSKLNHHIGTILSEIEHDVTIISSTKFYLGRDRSTQPVSFEVVDEVKGNVSWKGREVTYFIQKLKRNTPSSEVLPDSIFKPSVNCSDSTAVADPAVKQVKAAGGDDAGSHDRILQEVDNVTDVTATEMNLKLKEVVNYLKTCSSTMSTTDPDMVGLNDTVEELSALLRGNRPLLDVAVAHARQSEPYQVEMRVINRTKGKSVRRRYSFQSDETKIQKILSGHQREWKGNTRNDENKVVVNRKRKASDPLVQVGNSGTFGKLRKLTLDLHTVERESDAGVNWEAAEDGVHSEQNGTVWGNTALGERVFARSRNYEYEYARIIRKELGLDCTWRVKFIGKMSSEETNVSFKHIFPISEFGIGTEVTYVGEGDFNGKSAKVIGHKRLQNPETGSLKVQHEIECGGTTLWCSHEDILLTENQASALRKLTDRFNTTAVRKAIQEENIVESRTRSGRKR